MAWCDDPNHPFAGVWAKLKRADENIVNLQEEIAVFFGGSKYPVIPDPNAEEWQDAVNYHRDLAIPIRFSVLSGEIVHHLRSCLDHVAWHFSSETYRRNHENAIAFPVLQFAPTIKDGLASYDRKIKGIENATVRALIEGIQPYQRGNRAANDPLLIVHNMDRFDKHRELVIVTRCVSMAFPPETEDEGILALLKFGQGKGNTLSSAELASAQRAMDKNPKVTPQIAFAQFGNGKEELVIPSLSQLLTAVADVVALFVSEV